MPPKKITSKKSTLQIVRPAISASSLVCLPEDVLPGFDERLETNIPWTAVEVGFRHHAKQCGVVDIPKVTFKKAFLMKLNQSALGNFLREDSSLTMEEQLELLVLPEWDTQNFGSEEAKICFRNTNSLTDNLYRIIREAVKKNDRKMLKERLKTITTLRLLDSKMTELDETLLSFSQLTVFNLCGNFLEKLDCAFLPATLQALELQANNVSTLDWAGQLPQSLVYLGLARNFLDKDHKIDMLRFSSISVLDLSDNDICDLTQTVEALHELKHLNSLALSGNPCAMCTAYAYYVLEQLPRIIWLDWREVLITDRCTSPEPVAQSSSNPAASAPTTNVHSDDLRSGYFVFTCYRIMSVPQPPKAEKGCTMNFYLEVEVPLLDSTRRQFLMYRHPSSLVEMLPEPEEYTPPTTVNKRGKKSNVSLSATNVPPPGGSEESEVNSQEQDIYHKLTTKNSREIINYTLFKSNLIPWAMIMNFQVPVIKIFCPDLRALRNTFRTDITVRLIFSMMTTKSGGGGAAGRKSTAAVSGAAGGGGSGQQFCVVCSVVCSLRAPDWSQGMQDFHWDDSLPDNKAIHWEDGDLSVLQYNIPTAKPVKGKPKVDSKTDTRRQSLPENLTCHYGFGIETMKRGL